MDKNKILDLKIEQEKKEDIEKDKPLSFGNYLSLPITEEERDLHTSHILKRINEIIDDSERKERIELAESWRNQYMGIMEETSFPWPGAYNLDMRVTPKIQDAVVAQTQEAFDDVDPHWTVGPIVNKEAMDVRIKQEKILDYYEDIEMNNNEDIEAIRHDAFLLGNGYEAVIFDKKFERVRELKIYKTAQEFINDFPDNYQQYPQYLEKLIKGEKTEIIVEYNLEIRRSPRRKHIEFEDAIVPLTAKGIEGINIADIAGRRVWMKWHEIKTLEDEGDYIQGITERLRHKAQLGKDGELIEDPDYLNKDYETFEVSYYIYIIKNEKKYRVRCLWNVEKEHGVCLRAIRYPYDHNRCYLISHSIKFTNKGHYQDGLGRMLQDLHIAGNATLNHILNASTLANSLSLKAKEGTSAARRIYEHRWYPGSVLELQNLNDAEQFQFSTPNLSSLIQLFALIEKFAQDVSGIVNYQLGVESPEDPEAPASKTIALMRKAEIKLRRYIKNLKRSEDEVGYQSLRLIYQFTPIEKLSEILGEQMDETKLVLRPHLKIVTNASGFAIERIFAKRDDMMMAGFLLKDPMIIGDPIKRSKLYYIVAKDVGSNWDKKIIGIVPTSEELEQEKLKAQQERQARKLEAVKGAAQKVLEAGGTEDEARNAGMEAGKMFEVMLQKEQMMVQQPQGK